MTVVATIITKHCVAHATDSLITHRNPDGRRTVVETRASKLVRVGAFSGAISYWGLARHGSDWDTHKWLTDQAGKAASHPSASAFAEHLASALTNTLRARRFRTPPEGGLGLHFSAYERVGDYWVPELFQIRNWVDESYRQVRPDGFEVRRETYGSILGTPDRSAEDGLPARRMEVHSRLQSDVLLRFVNGDPNLFNPLANALLGVFTQLYARGEIKHGNMDKTHLALVRRPVEVLSHLLTDLVPKDKRLIGGKPHDLAVRPGRRYHSTTGD
jgi:hypothetical protein